MKRNIIIWLNSILIVITLIIPFIPYKIHKEESNPNLDKIQFRFDSMDGFVSRHEYYGYKFYENSLIGNTLYDELTTFKNGNPTYIDFDLYGNIITDKYGNKFLNVKEWSPSYGNIKLMHTYIWEENIKDTYLIFLILIIIFQIFLVIKNKIHIT
ncbi:MAG: hypothetical protein ACRC1T_10165 [Clostridium chrysemydis]|uniref:hypothetical protein n=1 Tax=Clostridium chrysemydis TaxID=2665504 RepID=UPI003F2E1CE1